MAIDTRNERAGALAIGLPFARVFDNPDSGFGQGDRQQSALVFPGILADFGGVTEQPIRRRAMYVPGAWNNPGIFGPKAAT
ncbi:MAG: hypothetical protein IT518_20215 [Burkholderiales bacterium]|nr:hypothetical protein [Burkholderiales bacterium]